MFLSVISYMVLFTASEVNVFAQSSNSSPATIVPISVQTDRAPSFLEAYWTEDSVSTSTSTTNNSKKEIGPGEGTSTLAIVFVNRGRTDITGVTGYLTLPSGFRAIEGENNVTSPNVAVASYDSIIKAGDTFTMYFTMDVLPQAKVGPYTGDLTLSYSKILEVGQISTSMMIPFRVTGKVILDTTLLNQNLTAGYPNPLQILITNDGTANATGAVVTVVDVSGGTTASNSSTSKSSSINGSYSTTVDSESFNIGNIPAGSSVMITPIIYPDYSSEGTIQTLDLEIAYNNAYGIRTDSDYSIGMIVAPNPPESVLSINPGRISTTSSSQDNAGNNSKSNVNEAEDEINENPIKLTAGRLENLLFSITNNGSLPLTDIVFSLSSGTNSVKILGDSRWRIDYMAPQSSFPMSTTVYAAEDVINTPTEFEVKAEYIERGQSKTDTLSIGAYVDGQIRIRTYDLDINYVGGAPNLVGNLLNEGNTVALFTTIELFNPANNPELSQSNSNKSLVTGPSQQQYLGDLSENSPLPFSIPLSIDSESPAGNYPVSLNVTYSDNLRIVHELLLNDTVVYEGQPSASSNSNSNNAAFTLENGFSSIFPMVIIIIVVIAIGLFLIRRRIKRKKEGKRINTEITSASRPSDSNTINKVSDQDSDFFLDDESTSKNKP
ncbi:MAG: COG1361 S-layer family protein [Ignavibacteriales bacterium]